MEQSMDPYWILGMARNKPERVAGSPASPMGGLPAQAWALSAVRKKEVRRTPEGSVEGPQESGSRPETQTKSQRLEMKCRAQRELAKGAQGPGFHPRHQS